MEDTNRDKAIDKVAKLLALSTSSNENEAALAAARAQEIMLRYNLAQSEVERAVNGKTDYVTQRVENGSNRNWQRLLRWAVAKGHLCRYLTYRGTHNGVMIGKPANIEAANYLYDYLERELERLAEVAYNRRGYGEKRTWKNSYLVGAVHAVEKRMLEQLNTFKAETTETRALVVLSDAELDTAVTRFYPDTRKGTPIHTKHNDAYAAGYRDGSNVAFRRGVRHGSSTKQIGE